MKIRNIKCSVFMDDKIKEDLKKSEVYKFKLENEDVTVFVYGHSPKHLNVTG